MRRESSPADLLVAARETLAAEILPALQGRQRYAALMIANALGMVERELAGGGRLRSAGLALAAHAEPHPGADGTDVLCQAIRDGHHDGDACLQAALYTLAIAAVAVTRPEALTADERAAHCEKTTTREVLNGSGAASSAVRLC